VAALLLVAAAGCNKDNISGRLSAQGSGDLSHPPLERLAPAAETACGAGELTQAGVRAVRRHPYLQRVTTTSATVVWTSTSATPGQVMVSKVAGDGATAAEVPATLDATAPLPGGAHQWTASLADLQPNTTYCYEVREGGDLVVGRSPLTTAPVAGTGASVRIAVLGDSGSGGSDQQAVSKQLGTVPFDLMIHTGDIAYETGTLNDFETKFFDVYQPYLRRVPVFPTSGNHDYETADAEPYRQVFVLPDSGAPEGRERWYSYDWGDVHLCALDTEKMTPAQAAWLDADLAANKLPWTIVYGHKPPYSSGEHGGDATFRQLFEPVLQKHKVSLVLSGHDHDYERFRPQGGITYVVTGGGGRGVRLVGGSAMTAYAESVSHLVVVSVENDTLSVHAIDGVGREFDNAVISRGDH
jgi:predicted phosphodiesterase